MNLLKREVEKVARISRRDLDADQKQPVDGDQ